MNKSKLLKLLALFLSIGVVAAACGSDSDGDDAAPATTAAAPATTAEVEVVAGGSLLDTVQARGTLNCGVSGSAVAFSETQADVRSPASTPTSAVQWPPPSSATPVRSTSWP